MATWTELLEKWYQNTISEAELQEMHEQARQCPLKQKQFNKLSDPDEFLAELRALYAIDTETSWVKFARGKWPKNSHI